LEFEWSDDEVEKPGARSQEFRRKRLAGISLKQAKFAEDQLLLKSSRAITVGCSRLLGS
jgi:hypothetical protein